MEAPAKETRVIAPSTKQVIQAGESWEIHGTDNTSFEIQAREHDRTLEFLKAFDDWQLAKRQGVNTLLLLNLERLMMVAFDGLHPSVRRELVSFKSSMNGLRHG